MKKKPAKKQAARFDKAPVEDVMLDKSPLDSEAPLNEAESAAEFEAAEKEVQRGKEKKEKDQKAEPVLSVRVLSGEKPPLEKGQKYFETVDGRFLVGPEDAGSIPDPLNPGREVNPWRAPSNQLHR